MRAFAALALAAVLGACGGGGGGGSSTAGGSAATPSDAGAASPAAAVPSNLTLADIGPYPAKPVTTPAAGGGASGGGTGGTPGTGTGTGTGGAAYVPSGPKTLVLYDAPEGDEYQKLGFAYAIMLRNLLGHFDADVDLMPVQQYTAGQIAAHQATFYLGASYDNPLPPAFLADAAATAKPLVWFKYNLWQLSGDPAYRFTDTRGIAPDADALRGYNALPTATNQTPGFFDTVRYKGLDFVKYYKWDAPNNVGIADPDIGVVDITDTTKATRVVSIRNPKKNEEVAYVTRSGNFWYVADLPFSFIGPRDRYLVLSDLLHDMLGIPHAEKHLAMVRLEDVGAPVSQRAMQRLTDFLSSQNVGFSIAVIPHHKDPFGVGNGGVPQDIPFAQATKLRASLDYAKARGGEIVMHGYTHQYAAMKNPWSGVSGDDYEFWDIVHNAPVPEDSTQWALDRFLAGLWELTQFGYGPEAWETPHYVASATASRAMPLAFNTTYQRVVYFTADKPDFSPHAGKDFMAGQIFPYVIARDYYGQRVLPENLGNIEYDISRIDPSSNLTYTWDDIRINAQYAKTVRDGFASFFFHPFWIEKEIAAETNAQPFEDFKNLVQGITAQGYTWVTPSKLR